MDEQYTTTMQVYALAHGVDAAEIEDDDLGLKEVGDWLTAHDREVAEKAAKIADDFARENEGYYGVAPEHAIQAANEIAERIRQSIEGEQR